MSQRIEPAGNSAVTESILDAADRLFEQFGYRKTTVEEIAQEAGIGKGSIYVHFRSKEDVGYAWAQRGYSRMRATLEELVSEKCTACERIKALLTYRVMLRHDKVQKHHRSMDGSLGFLKKGLRPWRDSVFESEAQALAALIDIGIQNNELAACESLLDARAMILATNSLLPNFVDGECAVQGADLSERLAYLTDFLIRGLDRCQNPRK